VRRELPECISFLDFNSIGGFEGSRKSCERVEYLAVKCWI